jgi:hypothetical protein
MLGLATATASFSSGLMYASVGYNVMGIIGATVALIPLGLTGWWLVRKRQVAESNLVQSS